MPRSQLVERHTERLPELVATGSVNHYTCIFGTGDIDKSIRASRHAHPIARTSY